jgi:hypothetical protein
MLFASGEGRLWAPFLFVGYYYEVIDDSVRHRISASLQSASRIKSVRPSDQSVARAGAISYVDDK